MSKKYGYIESYKQGVAEILYQEELRLKHEAQRYLTTIQALEHLEDTQDFNPSDCKLLAVNKTLYELAVYNQSKIKAIIEGSDERILYWYEWYKEHNF